MTSSAHAIETTPHASAMTATGVPNGKLGMWLFLASEVMFFTGLLGAYIVLRISNPHWPGSEGHLSVLMGTINTLVLICSSTTVVMALAAAEHLPAEASLPASKTPGQAGAQAGQRLPAVRGWLALTIVLGSLFLVIKGTEYAAKFSHHIGPGTNIFWSCYFTLTGFHALHVLGGIIFNLRILRVTWSDRLWKDQGHRLELAGLYWHFVDIVWIFLFPLLYLL